MGQSIKDVYRIVALYRQFKRYDHLQYKDIIKLILPSINLGQYQIHRNKQEDVGFTNWAYLSDNVEQRFMNTGRLKDNEWKCGSNVWHIETVAKSNVREIMNWTKQYFKGILEVNQPLKWLRISDKSHIYRSSEKYKREFHI
jgi:cytolysin-activating lysine-acyltransferase